MDNHDLDTIFNSSTVDAVLAFLTIFHLFAVVCFQAKSSTAIRCYYAIAEPIMGFPFVVSGFTMGITAITIHLYYRAATIGDTSSTDTLRAVVSIYAWICFVVLQKISWSLCQLGPQRFLEIENEVERAYLKNLAAPPNWMRQLFFQVNLQESILRPEFTGIDNVPTDYPAMYVSNHSLWGLEAPTFLNTILKTKNVFLRGLADRFHFQMPHGELLQRFGVVNGTRDNVDGLMEGKQNILVYPGGGHEVLKPSAIPRYQLMWKERVGFARCAIKHGYPIVPCCAVGTEDMLDTMFDIDVGLIRKGLKIPVVAPILPHRIQKVYFWVGEPIPTSQYQGDWQNDDHAREVRDKVKTAVQAGIEQMKQKQANDPNRFLLAYIRNISMARLRSLLQNGAPFCASNVVEEHVSSSCEKFGQDRIVAKKGD